MKVIAAMSRNRVIGCNGEDSLAFAGGIAVVQTRDARAGGAHGTADVREHRQPAVAGAVESGRHPWEGHRRARRVDRARFGGVPARRIMRRAKSGSSAARRFTRDCCRVVRNCICPSLGATWKAICFFRLSKMIFVFSASCSVMKNLRCALPEGYGRWRVASHG